MHDDRAVTPQRHETACRTPAYWLYAIAIFASSLAVFGPLGVLAGMFISGAWYYVFVNHARPVALVRVIVVMLLGVFLYTCLVPMTQSAERRGTPVPCRVNLRNLGLALHNYHADHGSFPPAFTTDEEGRPLLSWRVLILPYLGKRELYESFDLTEPWDGPNNQKLLDEIPAVFTCPSSCGHRDGDDACTSYVAVVGEETAWPGAGTRAFRDLGDGPTLTLLVVEYGAGRIPWTEPRDLEFSEALEALAATDPDWASGHQSNDFFVAHCSGGRYVTFADGRVAYASYDGPTWRELFAVNDGGPGFDHLHVFRETSHKTRLRVGNCLRGALFGFVALLPLPWVWLNPSSQVRTPRR